MDCENVLVAVGVSLLSYLQSEISVVACALPVNGGHVWFINHPRRQRVFNYVTLCCSTSMYPSDIFFISRSNQHIPFTSGLTAVISTFCGRGLKYFDTYDVRKMRSWFPSDHWSPHETIPLRPGSTWGADFVIPRVIVLNGMRNHTWIFIEHIWTIKPHRIRYVFEWADCAIQCLHMWSCKATYLTGCKPDVNIYEVRVEHLDWHVRQHVYLYRLNANFHGLTHWSAMRYSSNLISRCRLEGTHSTNRSAVLANR